MAKQFLILFTILVLNHEVLSQILRQPLGLLNQPISETIIESPRQYIHQLESPRQYIQQLESPRQYIQQLESPRYIAKQQIIDPYHIIPTPSVPINIPNSPINIPNAPSALITDCSPSVCKNLANTIQLMVVSNLLQNKNGGDEISSQLAAPVLSNLLSASLLPGYSSPAANLRTPNLLTPNSIGPNFVIPNLVSSNFVAPTPAPRFVPSVTPNNMLSSVSSNSQIERGLLSKVLKLLGGGV